MTNSVNPSGAGLVEAATKFEALLAGDNSPTTQTTEPADAAIVEDSDSNTEPLNAQSSEDETPPEASNEEADGAEEDEGAANAEDSEESQEPEVQLVTVKIDGKEEQIPLEEAIKGYQRHADYSRKMAEVKQGRESLQAELAEVKQERAQYAELLNALSAQLAQQTEQEPNWEELYQSNPLEYVRQKDLWRDRQERLAAASQEQQRLAALQAQEQQALIASTIQESQQKLVEAVPEWKDQKRWEQDRKAIREFGNKLGFSDEELSQAYDHRAVLALYKAMKYDAIMANKPLPNKKGTAPKVASAGSQANLPPTKPKKEIFSAKQRLAKSGRLGDAAALFEKLI